MYYEHQLIVKWLITVKQPLTKGLLTLNVLFFNDGHYELPAVVLF